MSPCQLCCSALNDCDWGIKHRPHLQMPHRLPRSHPSSRSVAPSTEHAPLSRLPCFHPSAQSANKLHSRTFLAAVRLLDATLGALHRRSPDRLPHVLCHLQPTCHQRVSLSNSTDEIAVGAVNAVPFVSSIAYGLLEGDRSCAKSRRLHVVALLDLIGTCVSIAAQRGGASAVSPIRPTVTKLAESILRQVWMDAGNGEGS